MEAAALWKRGVGSLIGVNPVGSAWIRERIASLVSVPRVALDGEGSWQALRQAVSRRVAAHSHARYLSSEDLDDIVGEVLARAAPALMGRDDPVRNPSAFVNRVIANQFHQFLRKSGPAWTGLKDEIVDIARGRRGEQGLALWHCDGTALIGLSGWRHRNIEPTDAYIDSLASTGRWHRAPERHGLDPDLATGALLRALLGYLGTPVPISHLVNLVFELRGTQELRRISLDELAVSREEPADPGDPCHDAETRQTVQEIALACEALDDDRLAAFVFRLEGETASCLLGSAGPALVARIQSLFALAFPPDGKNALQQLPLCDKHTARIIGLRATGTRDAQLWISNLRRSAQRRISREVLGSAARMKRERQQEVPGE